MTFPRIMVARYNFFFRFSIIFSLCFWMKKCFFFCGLTILWIRFVVIMFVESVLFKATKKKQFFVSGFYLWNIVFEGECFEWVPSTWRGPETKLCAYIFDRRNHLWRKYVSVIRRIKILCSGLFVKTIVGHNITYRNVFVLCQDACCLDKSKFFKLPVPIIFVPEILLSSSFCVVSLRICVCLCVLYARLVRILISANFFHTNWHWILFIIATHISDMNMSTFERTEVTERAKPSSRLTLSLSDVCKQCFNRENLGVCGFFFHFTCGDYKIEPINSKMYAAKLRIVFVGKKCAVHLLLVFSSLAVWRTQSPHSHDSYRW